MTPLRDWRRHHPLAHRIAEGIPPAMLALTYTTLMRDIRDRHACGTNTAAAAIRIARSSNEDPTTMPHDLNKVGSARMWRAEELADRAVRRLREIKQFHPKLYPTMALTLDGTDLWLEPTKTPKGVAMPTIGKVIGYYYPDKTLNENGRPIRSEGTANRICAERMAEDIKHVLAAEGIASKGRRR